LRVKDPLVFIPPLPAWDEELALRLGGGSIRAEDPKSSGWKERIPEKRCWEEKAASSPLMEEERELLRNYCDRNRKLEKAHELENRPA
jgi:hypothetical protein